MAGIRHNDRQSNATEYSRSKAASKTAQLFQN